MTKKKQIASSKNRHYIYDYHYGSPAFGSPLSKTGTSCETGLILRRRQKSSGLTH